MGEREGGLTGKVRQAPSPHETALPRHSMSLPFAHLRPLRSSSRALLLLTAGVKRSRRRCSSGKEEAAKHSRNRAVTCGHTCESLGWRGRRRRGYLPEPNEIGGGGRGGGGEGGPPSSEQPGFAGLRLQGKRRAAMR